MKELEVYVRSYALGKTGIHWRKIFENSDSILGSPNMLEQKFIDKKTGDLGTIEYAINYQNLSLVIMRYSQQLLFMIAGVESVKKQTNKFGSIMETKIYNAVAWVGNDDKSNSIPSENELTLRHLAERALLSFVDEAPEFINTINEAINFNGLEEFAVERKKIDQLTENLKDKLDNAEGNQEIWDNKIETSIKGSEIFNFAEKLIETKLPKDDFAILINKVSENEVSVLSIDINPKKPEIPKIQAVLNSTLTKEKETNNENPTSQEGSGTTKKSKKVQIKLLLIIFLITSLVVLLLLVINSINKEKKQPQQVPIPQSLVAPKPPVPVTLR